MCDMSNQWRNNSAGDRAQRIDTATHSPASADKSYLYSYLARGRREGSSGRG